MTDLASFQSDVIFLLIGTNPLPNYVAALLREKVGKLRDLSPLWDMYKEGIDLESVQWAAH